MAGLNDRVMRVVLHEFRRGIQGRQHHIVAYQLCRPVWTGWFDRVVLSGALPVPAAGYSANPARWAAVKWMPQGWPYIHPVQDVTAAQSAIKAGFTSRSAVVSEQGEDAEVIDAEQAEDNRRADELGLVYESGTGAPEPEPPAPDPAPAAPTSVVNVTLPPQPPPPAPVVNVSIPPPEPTPPPVVNVTVEAQPPAPAPVVNLTVPPGPPAVVNVAMPQRAAESLVFEHDADGNIIRATPDPDGRPEA
jgi:hypothetical protein